MSHMKNLPPVVFYGYEASPASGKIENVLALKGIPHYRVEVAMTLPRPEINEALGIGYRRIPVLAMGNDVYCDTSLIASALEHEFSPTKGFPTIFPSRKNGGKADTGIIELLATFYTDRALFTLATALLPYDKFSPEFIEDRNKWLGAPLDIAKLKARQPIASSLMSSHLTFLEKQLADGREWVFDTTTAGYGDLALHHMFGWVTRFKGVREHLSNEKLPHTVAWLTRMAELIRSKRAANADAISKIDGTAAAEIIASNVDGAHPEIEFDKDEAKLLGLRLGEKVLVVPDDNARNYPTVGELIGLSREETVLLIKGSSVPSLRCHFPRLNYSVSPVTPANSKL